MREIPAEVITLLKSRKQIGQNKPSWEVTVENSSLIDWESESLAWNNPATALYNGSHLTCATKANGKLICVLSKQGASYEGECDSIDDLINIADSITGLTQITGVDDNRGWCSVSNADGELFLCVNCCALNDVIYAHKLYKSPSGNGGDWVYYSTIQTYTASGTFFEGTGESIDKDSTGCIKVLSNGRWAIIAGDIVYWYGMTSKNNAIYVSDDKGITWVKKFTFKYALSSNPLLYNCPKNITEASDGTLYIDYVEAWSIAMFHIAKSIDFAETWVDISNVSAENWGNSSILAFNNKLYLYVSHLQYSCIFEVIDFNLPLSNPVLEFNSPSNGSCSTMKIVGNKLIVTHDNYVLNIDVIEPKVPVKSINISRNKSMAGSLNLVIDNKDGEWSPDNAVYPNVMFPNTELTVRQGYGTNLVQTFKGLIDRIELTTFPAEIKLSNRDKLKLALDQTITGAGNTHTITYNNQTIEYIFADLCSKAGLSVGTVEETGLTIAEKTFSWESYADCFSWLADLVGFDFGIDEDGNAYFRKEGNTQPAAEGEEIYITNGKGQIDHYPIVQNSEMLTDGATTTYVRDTDYTIDYETGEITSITIADSVIYGNYVYAAYTFREGEDIVSLGYTIDDNDLYYEVIVVGKAEDDSVISATAAYPSRDYYKILPQKVMKIDVSDATTVEQCQAIANRAVELMNSKARIVNFAAIAVPWLQIGDVIRVIESSTTINELYRITDLSSTQDGSGYMMQITCYHHSA